MTKQIPDEAAKFIIENSRDPLKGFDWENANPAKLKWAKTVQKNLKDAEPIEKDFRAHGFNIVALSDLTNFKQYLEDERVIPLAFKWISKTNNPDLKSSLIRAIWRNPYIKKYPEVTELLLDIWEKEAPPDEETPLRNIIGNYLWRNASDRNFSKLKQLVIGKTVFRRSDELKSTSRPFLFEALTKMKKNKKAAADIIASLLSREQKYLGFPIGALGKLGQKESILVVEQYLNDSDKDLQRTAEKAIKLIKKKQKTS